ncbi:MAG TPA: CocE/NonD family hydrolase [Egicoccus sp.]|nr:CocE/NonD family hydrolase [Egicoccus sp.]HSK23140.1 CocE/NonD family hydrolase [Egicoccus sp.]
MRTVLRSLSVTAMLAVAVAVATVAPPPGARADLAAVESPLDAPEAALGGDRRDDGRAGNDRAGEGERGARDERGPRTERGPRDGRGRPDRGDDRPAPRLDEAAPPFDYVAQADALSQPQYPIEKFATTVPAFDGEEIYVEVTLPERHDEIEQWPVILEASPYHGTLADREGIRIFPDAKDADGNHVGLTGYFAPRGYAVVMMDLRGTGMSSGCLDHLGPNDAKDLKTVVEWAASQPWSSGEVGMTGHSYVGSTPAVAAAQDPDGLVTIAPSAGLGSMYDHQFHNGVPWMLQYAGPIFAYEQLALERDLPDGEHFGERPEQTGCGLQNSAATAGHGQATGEWQAWHTVRDHRAGAAAWDGPIFMIHGVNDNAARIPAAEWFFADRDPNPTDKVWIGQWDHGSAGATSCAEAESVGHVNCRFEQWKYALHAWFDKHLQHRDVRTGPPVEAFLNGAQVTTGDAWDATPGALRLYPDATDGSLRFQAPSQPTAASFTSVAGEGATEFVTTPFIEDTTFLGMPELDLDVSTTTSAVLHVVTTLFAEDADGNRRPMNFCAANTMLRHDVRTPAPVVPGEVMDLDLQCFTAAHHVAKGERLVLSVGTSSQHHVPTHTTDLQVSVHTGPGTTSAYTLPLDADAVVHPDVERFEATAEVAPLDGPAQAPASGTVVVVAPGAGVIVEPATAAAFEFTVEDGFDNVTLEAVATPATPADLDIYLQRRLDDGTWSENLAAGAGGDLDREALTYTVPSGIEAGGYRILVHNWAGAPNQVGVEVSFTNADGDIGS